MSQADSFGAQSATSGKPAEIFLKRIKGDYPEYSFKRGKQEYWSPGSKTITYNPARDLEELQYGILHELSHAILEHINYSTDFELLRMEAEAWHKAAKIGSKYGVDISQDHIQNCLDTYRDWLHRRSTCPACGVHVLQAGPELYKCFNCRTEWTVTSGRFVRAYRKMFK